MDRNYLETVTAVLYDSGWRSIDRLDMVRELNFICYLLDEIEKKNEKRGLNNDKNKYTLSRERNC